MKQLILLVFCLFITVTPKAQMLRNVSIDLNGGEVFDMAYISTLNKYVIVGNFSQINAQTRNKVAFLDEDGNLSSDILPWTIDNNVFSCEAIGSNIYLGGDFTTIGATSKHGLARITFTGSVNPIFSLSTWGPLPAGKTIHDMTVNGSAIIAVGDFNTVYNNVGTAFTRNNIFCFTPTGTINPYFTGGALVHSSDLVNRLHVERTSTGFVVSGFQLQWNSNAVVGALLFDFSGNYLQNITYSDGFSNTKARDIAIVSDSLWAIERFYTLSNIGAYSYNPQTSASNTITVSGNTCFAGSAPQGSGIESYQGDLLFFDDNSSVAGTLARGKYTFSGGYQQTFCQLVTLTGGAFNPNFSPHLKVVRNKMILSVPTMSQANGQLHARAAFYCLEPENAKPFTVFDTTICSGNERTYTIPPALYAIGYRWSYTGTGVTYTTATQLIPQPFSGAVDLSNVNGNSITLQFGADATSGLLKVEPYSTCNPGDYLYSKPQSLNLHTVALPDLTLNGDSIAFTCIVDTMQLIANSSVAGVNYTWFYPNTLSSVGNNDTLSVFGSGSPSVIYPTGMYYAMVTEPVNGCKSTDSIWVWENTVAPTITQDSLLISPPEFTCAVTQLNLSTSVAGSTIYWTTQSDTTIHFPNPHTVYSTDPSSYYAFAISNSNGCKAQQAFIAQSNNTIITGYLPNYSNYPLELVTDTINCSSNALAISCAVSPLDPNAASGSAYWLINNSQNLLLSAADSAGMFLNTNTYRFITLNNENGCTDTNDVTIYFDLDVPFVTPYSGVSSINCSVDTLTLVHTQTGGMVTESWLDNSGIPTGSNSVFVNEPGTFVYEVTGINNGCKATDTVVVTQTNELLLASNDTLVCPDIGFTVTTTPINISETVSYTWQNGETTASANGIGGMDTVMTVIATTPSGCIGYDTILVSVTDPISATIGAFMSCGATSGSLQITTISGGAGSYQYAIDGSNFSTNLLFDSLAEGNYTISVKDALGCVYTFDVTLDAAAGAPESDFLVATYSGIGDTVAIVNTTIYQGFDSTVWIFPNGTNVFQANDSIALIQLPDTGWVTITLIGFQDTCSYSFSKTIYVGEVAPEFPTNYSSVKIQSINVYPNPTNSAFTVDIVFGVAQNYAVIVTNDLAQAISGMYVSGYGTSVSLPFIFPQSAQTGMYHVHIISDHDLRQINLILD